MKNKTFTKDFWIYLVVFIIIIAIICLFPFLLTRNGCLDFTDTGEIGDTIGGIMGPFVAIAAAILTFFAFWVQFKANEQQRKDIALERFESNLFELLHFHQEITNELLLKCDLYNINYKYNRCFIYKYENKGIDYYRETYWKN